MKLKTTLLSGIIGLAIIYSSCSPKLAHKDSEPEGPAAAVQTKNYPAVGVVTALDPKLSTIEINHEEVKGLMPAMQMQFHLKDKALLDGLRIGDKIEFTIENGVGGMRVVALHKL